MREVGHIQIGQGGIQIGQQFWKKLLNEHSLDSEGNFVGTDSEAIRYGNTYFNTTIDNKFVPRGLIIDTDSSTIESVQNSELKNLFSANNIIGAEYSPDGNKALVEYTYPSEIKSVICEGLRLEAEAGDSLQSFQIVCALGGATSSSILNLILRYLREEYGNSIVEADVIYPSTNDYQNNAMEIYNSVLCSIQLSEHTDYIVAMDNEALYQACFKYNNLK